MALKHFVEWDTFALRVDGERINELLREMVADRGEIVRLALRFSNGLMRVEGAVRKVVTVPFTVDIVEIRPEGTKVRVPLRGAAAFGGIPIPQFLFRFAKNRLPRDVVTFEEPATFVIALDRFLPNFVSVDIESISIVDGGLAVTLGRGGADLPP